MQCTLYFKLKKYYPAYYTYASYTYVGYYTFYFGNIYQAALRYWYQKWDSDGYWAKWVQIANYFSGEFFGYSFSKTYSLSLYVYNNYYRIELWSFAGGDSSARRNYLDVWSLTRVTTWYPYNTTGGIDSPVWIGYYRNCFMNQYTGNVSITYSRDLIGPLRDNITAYEYVEYAYTDPTFINITYYYNIL